MFDINLYDDEDIMICEDYAIDIYAGEILTEFATVARDFDLNMSVAVNPDKNRNLYDTEYFKVYNHTDPSKADKIARIKFRYPEYVIHRNNGGKKNWVLNTRQRKDLISLLNKPCKKHTGLSIWQGLILDFNYETGLDYSKTMKNKENPEKSEKLKKLKYPDYIPIDLKIPNYSFLIDIK